MTDIKVTDSADYKDSQTKLQKLLTNDNDKEIVLVKTNCFPVYGQDFISSKMVVALNLNGTAETYYDNLHVEYHKNDVAVILPGHVIRPISSSHDYDVILLIISESLVTEFKYRSLSHDYMKYHYIPSSGLDDDEFGSLLDIVGIIKRIIDSELEHEHEMYINLLNVFFELLRSYRIAKNPDISKYSKNEEFFNRFCGLLAAHYTESREVSFYANKLCLTPKYFSKIIRDVTQQSARFWIMNYIGVMAKQLLTTRPDLNIQTISNLIGFDDQASFSRYFHRAVGVSPKEFRAQNEI